MITVLRIPALQIQGNIISIQNYDKVNETFPQKTGALAGVEKANNDTLQVHRIFALLLVTSAANPSTIQFHLAPIEVDPAAWHAIYTSIENAEKHNLNTIQWLEEIKSALITNTPQENNEALKLNTPPFDVRDYLDTFTDEQSQQLQLVLSCYLGEKVKSLVSRSTLIEIQLDDILTQHKETKTSYAALKMLGSKYMVVEEEEGVQLNVEANPPNPEDVFPSIEDTLLLNQNSTSLTELCLSYKKLKIKKECSYSQLIKDICKLGQNLNKEKCLNIQHLPYIKVQLKHLGGALKWDFDCSPNEQAVMHLGLVHANLRNLTQLYNLSMTISPHNFPHIVLQTFYYLNDEEPPQFTRQLSPQDCFNSLEKYLRDINNILKIKKTWEIIIGIQALASTLKTLTAIKKSKIILQDLSDAVSGKLKSYGGIKGTTKAYYGLRNASSTQIKSAITQLIYSLCTGNKPSSSKIKAMLDNLQFPPPIDVTLQTPISTCQYAPNNKFTLRKKSCAKASNAAIQNMLTQANLTCSAVIKNKELTHSLCANVEFDEETGEIIASTNSIELFMVHIHKEDKTNIANLHFKTRNQPQKQHLAIFEEFLKISKSPTSQTTLKEQAEYVTKIQLASTTVTQLMSSVANQINGTQVKGVLYKANAQKINDSHLPKTIQQFKKSIQANAQQSAEPTNREEAYSTSDIKIDVPSIQALGEKASLEQNIEAFAQPIQRIEQTTQHATNNTSNPSGDTNPRKRKASSQHSIYLRSKKTKVQ